MRINRVGGLYHWRIGRLGGSFYRTRRAAESSVQDMRLARLATFGFAFAALLWSRIVMGG